MTKICSQFERAILGAPYARPFRITQATRQFNKRVEHHLQIKSRTTDNLEHVGGRGLLRKRLVALTD